MSQQINLKSTEAKPVSQGVWFVLAIVAYAVALAAFGVFRSTQATEAETAVRALEAREQALQVELSAVEQSSAAGKVTRLEAQIAERRNELQSLASLTTAIEAGTLGARTGPTRVLRSLANVSESGVWLQSIDIDPTGRGVKLAGNALGYESVVRYSERLNRSLQPLGIQFDSIDITSAAGATTVRGGASAPLTFTLN